MNLTVGPLPPGVYWRRRALVLGALVVVVALIVSMCGGSGEGKTSQGAPGATGSPSTSSTILTPVVEGTVSPSTGASSSPTVEPSTQAPVDTGPPPSPCLDSEMSLTVLATVRRDDVYLQMKIKNISNRACSRDVGGIPQEIHVATAASQPTDPPVWSSDFCQAPNQPADVRTFGPGIESILPPGGVLWRKNYVSTGCTVVKPAPPGSYSIAAKMGTLVSPVVHVTI
jgi:hypothetical protein